MLERERRREWVTGEKRKAKQQGIMVEEVEGTTGVSLANRRRRRRSREPLFSGKSRRKERKMEEGKACD